jgi:hypothetical protein
MRRPLLSAAAAPADDETSDGDSEIAEITKVAEAAGDEDAVDEDVVDETAVVDSMPSSSSGSLFSEQDDPSSPVEVGNPPES